MLERAILVTEKRLMEHIRHSWSIEGGGDLRNMLKNRCIHSILLLLATCELISLSASNATANNANTKGAEPKPEEYSAYLDYYAKAFIRTGQPLPP